MACKILQNSLIRPQKTSPNEGEAIKHGEFKQLLQQACDSHSLLASFHSQRLHMGLVADVPPSFLLLGADCTAPSPAQAPLNAEQPSTDSNPPPPSTAAMLRTGAISHPMPIPVHRTDIKGDIVPKTATDAPTRTQSAVGSDPWCCAARPVPSAGFPPAPSTAAARCSLGMDAGWARAPTMGTGARLERFYPEINRETSGEGKESKTRGPPPAPHHCNSGRSEAATCQSLPGGSFHPPPRPLKSPPEMLRAPGLWQGRRELPAAEAAFGKDRRRPGPRLRSTERGEPAALRRARTAHAHRTRTSRGHP